MMGDISIKTAAFIIIGIATLKIDLLADPNSETTQTPLSSHKIRRQNNTFSDKRCRGATEGRVSSKFAGQNECTFDDELKIKNVLKRSTLKVFIYKAIVYPANLKWLVCNENHLVDKNELVQKEHEFDLLSIRNVIDQFSPAELGSQNCRRNKEKTGNSNDENRKEGLNGNPMKNKMCCGKNIKFQRNIVMVDKKVINLRVCGNQLKKYNPDKEMCCQGTVIHFRKRSKCDKRSNSKCFNNYDENNKEKIKNSNSEPIDKIKCNGEIEAIFEVRISPNLCLKYSTVYISRIEKATPQKSNICQRKPNRYPYFFKLDLSQSFKGPYCFHLKSLRVKFKSITRKRATLETNSIKTFFLRKNVTKNHLIPGSISFQSRKRSWKFQQYDYDLLVYIVEKIVRYVLLPVIIIIHFSFSRPEERNLSFAPMRYHCTNSINYNHNKKYTKLNLGLQVKVTKRRDNFLLKSMQTFFKAKKYSDDWPMQYFSSGGDFLRRNHNNFVYPVKANIERLASFSKFNNTSRYSFLKLGQFGFYYTGQNDVIQCADCGMQVGASDVVTPPSDKKYHSSKKCSFAQTGTEENYEDELETDSVEASENILFPSSSASSDRTLDEIKLSGSCSPDTGYFTHPFDESASGDTNEIKDQCHSANMKDTNDKIQQYPHSLMSTYSFDPNKHQLERKPHSKDPIHDQSVPAAVTQCDAMATVGWLDVDHFAPEAAYSIANQRGASYETDLNFINCDKNVKHSDLLISPSELGMEKLPEEMRFPDILAFMNKAHRLTLKIFVTSTSSYRPVAAYAKTKHDHFGSGTAYLDTEDKSKQWLEELENTGNLTLLQKEFISKHLYSKGHSYSNETFLFSVMTSKHVIFDQDEAYNAVLECDYNTEPDQHSKPKDKAQIRGVAVKQAQIEGDYKSYLICTTEDKSFKKWLQVSRQELDEAVDTICDDAKEILTKNCFLAFHPHGLERKLSFGKCDVVNYAIVNNDTDEFRGQKTIQYCDNEESLMSSSNSLREVLLYKAPTCPGSSGCPVFTFRKINQRDQPKYILCLWIHLGVERSTNLGGSIMKTITETDQLIRPMHLKRVVENLSKPSKLPTVSPSQITQIASQTETSKVSACSRSEIPPLYPAFFSWEFRLESFVNASFRSSCSHSPAELALAGFFFTGDGDCVRCFYCGLGLKGWKSNDNVYVEHERASPKCGFLKVCLNYGEVKNLKLMQTGQVKEDQSTNLEVNLLQQENKLLQLKQFCKMCCRHLIKELFLPCGELLTCEECNEILSRCPSCDKKIEATITVFMS